MGGQITNLLVIIVGGIILADILAHGTASNNLLGSLGSMWSTSVNGMLGNAGGGTQVS